MILIADAGSTKCDWIGINDQKEVVLKVRSKGINPSILKEEEIIDRLTICEELFQVKDKVDKIYFYGAGCGLEKNQNELKAIYQEFFTNASFIQVLEDLAAAVYACTTIEPGIVSILGTGSNCCYFDGKDIITRMPALGYKVMDDASGNFMGKSLLRAYFFKLLPEHLRKQFEEDFDTDPGEIKLNLYKKPNANAYLAGYAMFLFKHIEEPFIQDLIKESVESFVKTHLNLFKEEAKTYPLHFVGSIAYFSQDQIKEVLNKYGMKTGKFVRRPIEELVHYHTK
ncbi:N-acetylglucosamine kinase [Zhouia sp. PK063]|uniref:N-acetylglucosamine kinase n=1 Tax=Zhouia sp. PK063 TaxID=3373602 RepID=UPI0037BAB163